jgi:hypothetical protein
MIRLAEPHLLDRHWLALGERADLPRVSGVVGGCHFERVVSL